MSDDTRPVLVRLHTVTGSRTQTVAAGPLATDVAIVDMARQEAGVNPEAFETGEVIA